MKRLSAWLGADQSARCALAFLLIAAPALLLLCFIIPPFEGNDEPTHFLRAIALAGGHIVPDVARHDPEWNGQPSAGGPVDAAAAAMAGRFLVLDHAGRLDLARRVGHVMPAEHDRYVGHSNTAIYPPWLYLQSIVAISAARLLHLPVVGWLYASRLANALFALALIGWSLRRAGPASVSLMVAATLPLTLFQLSIESADASLLPWTIAFAALLCRAIAGLTLGRAEHLVLIVATLFVATGKVAYLPLAALPLVVFAVEGGLRDRRGWLYGGVFAAGVLLWAGWASIVHDKIFSITDMPVDPAGQLRAMASCPAATLAFLAHEVTKFLPNMAVGMTGTQLGRERWSLPHLFNIVSFVLLVATALLGVARRTVDVRVLSAGVVAVGFSYLAIFLLIYLQFNPVGAHSIEGVQPRYLLPLAIVLIAVCPGWRVPGRAGRLLLPAAAAWSAVGGIALVGYLAPGMWT